MSWPVVGSCQIFKVAPVYAGRCGAGGRWVAARLSGRRVRAQCVGKAVDLLCVQWRKRYLSVLFAGPASCDISSSCIYVMPWSFPIGECKATFSHGYTQRVASLIPLLLDCLKLAKLMMKVDLTWRNFLFSLFSPSGSYIFRLEKGIALSCVVWWYNMEVANWFNSRDGNTYKQHDNDPYNYNGDRTCKNACT